MRCQLRFSYARLLVAGLAIPRFALAQVQVESKSGSAIQVWAGELHAAPPSSNKPSKDPITVTTQGFSEKAVVVAYDPATNRLAQRKVAEAQGTWTAAVDEFTRIGRVTLRFQSEGKPVATANYSVKIGSESWVGLIAPTDKGEAILWSLPPGDMEVSVSYRAGGETKKLKPTPIFKLKLEESAGLSPISVTLPAGVDVIEAASTNPSTTKVSATSTTEDATPSNPIGRIIVYLAGLLVGAAAIYGLIRVVTSNREAIDSQLGKLGVQIPPDVEPNLTPDPVAPQLPSGPTPQIILTGSSTDPIPQPVGVASATNPRLVLDSGDIILLPIGSTSIGRDHSADHSLPEQNTLSRRHAEFTRSNDVVTVSDLGSTNGTFVNGIKLESSPIELKPGDEIQFGALHTRYQI